MIAPPKPRHFPRLKPKRLLGRKAVTVCIAAMTVEKYIVTLSDTRVGSFTSSADVSTVKLEPFAKDWLAMMAADDLTQCLSVIEKAATYFQNRANTIQVARHCLKRAYQNHLAEVATDRVLGRFQMSMKDFLKTGKRRFTESKFNALCEEIRSVIADWQFLAAGFDSQGMPHLFTVEEPGQDFVYDRPGFCAIGSGRHAAEGMLMYLGQNTVKNLYETVFNVYAAKFMAEKVDGVGKHCYLFIKKPGSTACSIHGYVEPDIRKEWEEKCAPRISREYIDRMIREKPIKLL